MSAYKDGYVKAHNSLYLFIEYLKCRYKQFPMSKTLQDEWNKYYNKYVIDLN